MNPVWHLHAGEPPAPELVSSGGGNQPGTTISFSMLLNLVAVAKCDSLAPELGCTPAQLALAWVLAQGEHVVPIQGTRSVRHLEENLGAAALNLGATTLARIDAIFAGDAIRGARYSAAMQAQIDTELLPGEEVEA